jgi:hypothetical protein
MARVNKKRETKKRVPAGVQVIPAEAHRNFMGGPSYDISNPILRLICMSASSFFGEPMYYKGQSPKFEKRRGKVRGYRHGYGLGRTLDDSQRAHLDKMLNAIDDYEWRSLSPSASMEKAISEALDYDPEQTLRWAVLLRREENIRVTPQVILVMAANHPKVKGTGLVRAYAPGITGRADEPATQLAYQLAAFGKPIPNALRRAWADYLSGANEYQLAKYRMENREVKTVDVARLAYGNGFFGHDNAVGKLLRGELSLGEGRQTWESIRSAGGSWEDAIKVMGHMALLRNIRNFQKHGVDTKLWLDKLVGTAAKGKQLPFRYVSAYLANKGAPGNILDAIEECLMLSLANLPRFEGRTMSLSDNSGSAHGTPVSELSTMTIAQIGNLMGVLTGMVSDEGMAYVFGDRLNGISIRKKASVFDQLEQLRDMGREVGGGTENGIWLALDKAIRDGEHWDNIFVYSDMQAGHGGLYGTNPSDYKQYQWPGRGYREYIDVPKMIAVYRERVNPRVNVFLVQIAGYEDTLIPEYFDRTYIIGGWSGSILRFAKRMNDTMDQYSGK